MLLLGGPFHGTERVVPNGQNELVVMAPSPGNPVPTPFRYVRKGIQAETRPGMIFEREVMVDPNMPAELANQALGAVLLERFASELLRQYMEGGIQVVPEESDSGIGTSESQTESGILIAKR